MTTDMPRPHSNDRQVQGLRSSEAQPTALNLPHPDSPPPESPRKWSKELSENDIHKHFKCPHATPWHDLVIQRERAVQSENHLRQHLSGASEFSNFTCRSPGPFEKTEKATPLGCPGSTPGCLSPCCTQSLQGARLSMHIPPPPPTLAWPLLDEVPKGLFGLA